MLQDFRLIRHYQALIDAMQDLWQRGYRPDDLRMLVDGYLMALRTVGSFEPYEISRIQEEVLRYLGDPSNFEMPLPEPETLPRSWY